MVARQGNLFDPFGRHFARQGELFAPEDLSTTLRCEACGEYLVRTPSGYLTCPRGCGKLREADDTGGIDHVDVHAFD
jgi:hypothetical protein